jgi:hypothetical protein
MMMMMMRISFVLTLTEGVFGGNNGVRWRNHLNCACVVVVAFNGFVVVVVVVMVVLLIGVGDVDSISYGYT